MEVKHELMMKHYIYGNYANNIIYVGLLFMIVMIMLIILNHNK